MQIFEELQARGLLAQLTDEDQIRDLVNNGKATFYIGFDPTADSLHVGHFMALLLMKRLQAAGNRPVALVGGGTGMIGDPSGRQDLRTMMTVEQIDHNCECFKKQMSRFIEFGPDKALMVNNADWLRDLNYIEFIRDIGVHFSVNNMLRARCYEQRMEKGLSFLEFNYMIMQAYDFLCLYEKYGCNMQFGGDDQWSNMLAGTELIRKKLGEDAHAMTNWRNIGDADVLKCLRMMTFLPLEQIDEMDKWEGAQLNTAKEILAHELTTLVHGEDEAVKAEKGAKALFAAGGAGDMENVPEVVLTADDLQDDQINILTALVKSGLEKSRSDARRDVKQGGVTVEGEKITDIDASFDKAALEKGILIRRGKKSYKRLRFE